MYSASLVFFQASGATNIMIAADFMWCYMN